jgi:ATP-binding cassette subfamily B protein
MRMTRRAGRREAHRQDAHRQAVPRQHLIRAAFAMMRPYRRRSLLALGSVLGALVTTLAGPSLVEYLINDGLVNHHSMRVVNIAGGLYVLAALASFIFTRWQTRLLSGTGELILNDLRKRVFAHLLAQPMSFYDNESSGQLLSRMTADIDVLESLIQSGIGTFVMSIGLFAASIVVLIVIAPLMFVATALCLAPVVIAAAHYRTASTRAYRTVRTRIGATLASLDEGLAGVRVIQAFRQERRVGVAFDQRNAAQYESEVNTVRLSSAFFPKIEGSGVLTTAAILLIGGLLVHEHLTSVGAVAAYVLYVGNLFNSIQSLSQLFDLLQSSGAAFGTVVALLDTESTMVDPTEPVALPRLGTLELRDVHFAYGGQDTGAVEAGEWPLGDLTVPGTERADGADEPADPAGEAPLVRPALSAVDLAVEQGEHLVLVGPTGAGKSTLAKLIGRLYDPGIGAVRFGGVDLRRTSLARLRNRIVVVPQEGFLFRGSVLDNILIGRPGAKEREARIAVEALGLAERLDELPDGLLTDVGERGSHLSAGERQLVSLARAALTDPAVLVMDEATSSIDPGTERYVEKAFAALTAGRTTITVAHRLTIAQRADRVALIDDGRVVEVGAHDDLVAADGPYARLFAAWQGSSEGADGAGNGDGAGDGAVSAGRGAAPSLAAGPGQTGPI